MSGGWWSAAPRGCLGGNGEAFLPHARELHSLLSHQDNSHAALREELRKRTRVADAWRPGWAG
jgi:hypothetical protein